MIPWQKKQDMGKMVVMGESEKQVQLVEGLFIGTTPDLRYGGLYYNIITAVSGGGELLSVKQDSGLKRITPKDIGKLVRIEFKGRVPTKQGNRVKQFDISVYDGPATPEILAEWPQYGGVKAEENAGNTFEDVPSALTQASDDDDLPF